MKTLLLNAAQPQANAPGTIDVFVPGLALRGVALNGAISSPTNHMRLGAFAKQVEDRSLGRSTDLRLLRRFFHIVLGLAGMVVVALEPPVISAADSSQWAHSQISFTNTGDRGHTERGVSFVGVDDARRALSLYRAELDELRKRFAVSDRVPDVPFFLFGMGARAKYWYQAGQLREAPSGRVVRQWAVREAIIVPPEYRVVLELNDGGTAEIREDEQGIWITEKGRRLRLAGSEARVNLPELTEHCFPRVLRVLHQELLVNVINGKPVPNLFVYSKPWLRDGAMMGMAFKATGNLHVIREWILGLREVYDRNNAGEEEADNLGQALYLISLVSDRTHPLVKKILAELPRWEVIKDGRKFILGRSDFAAHPVYQTKWLKYGLRALGLPDPYTVPQMNDSYSAMVWWDYRDAYVPGNDARDRDNYPYLGWAVDHFHGEKGSPISNRDYPLTWERHASQANYAMLDVLDPVFVREKIAAPHTWHAAEVFLYLMNTSAAP